MGLDYEYNSSGIDVITLFIAIAEYRRLELCVIHCGGKQN